MATKNKKVGNRASNSINGKTIAEDIFSVASDTTLPNCQVEEDETDSFASSVYSVTKDDDMGTDGSGTRPAETQAPRRANTTFIDISAMKKATQHTGCKIQYRRQRHEPQSKKGEAEHQQQ